MKDSMKQKLLDLLRKHGKAGPSYIGEYRGIPTMIFDNNSHVLVINKKLDNIRSNRSWNEPGWMMTTIRGHRSVVIQCIFCKYLMTPRPGVHTIDKIGRMKPCLECLKCGQGTTYFLEGWIRQKNKKTVLDVERNWDLLTNNNIMVKGEVIA